MAHLFLEPSHLAQEQIGVLPRGVDIFDHYLAAVLACIVYDKIAEIQQSLIDSGRHCNVLYAADRYVSRRLRNEARIYFDARVGELISDETLLHMKVRRYQKQKKCEDNRYHYIYRSEQAK